LRHVRHLRIVGEVSKALKRPGGEPAWPEPSEDFVHQLSEDITELRRPAPRGGRFKLSFALIGAVALLLPLAAFADQAGDNLARRDDAVDVQLVATDDDGTGGGDDDSESSVAGAYDVAGGDTDSESSAGAGAYDVGGGDDSGSDDGAAAAGGGDSDSDSGGAAADQAPLPTVPATPAAPEAPAGGEEDSDSGGEDT
jgi:hypothetical protein